MQTNIDILVANSVPYHNLQCFIKTTHPKTCARQPKCMLYWNAIISPLWACLYLKPFSFGSTWQHFPPHSCFEWEPIFTISQSMRADYEWSQTVAVSHLSPGAVLCPTPQTLRGSFDWLRGSVSMPTRAHDDVCGGGKEKMPLAFFSSRKKYGSYSQPARRWLQKEDFFCVHNLAGWGFVIMI